LEALLLKKLKKVKVVELCGFKMSERIAGLENLNDNGSNNRAWKNIRKNIKISHIEFIDQCEWEGYKPWYGKEG
jgi:hypothetical protein